jgi:hypothetical protein
MRVGHGQRPGDPSADVVPHYEAAFVPECVQDRQDVLEDAQHGVAIHSGGPAVTQCSRTSPLRMVR